MYRILLYALPACYLLGFLPLVTCVEILIPRNVHNVTYIDCYHTTPYDYVVESVNMTQPYPGHWDGVKGYPKGPRCFRHCINRNFLYAALTVETTSSVTMQLTCSCGNVRYYWSDRSRHHCHWNCTDWDDPIEEWCAYPDHHGATHLYELPGPEWPQVVFVNCNKHLLAGPTIAHRSLYINWDMSNDMELWSGTFFIEDCFYECDYQGYQYIGVHSFWNGKAMELECRCGHEMPKRGDEYRETFCPWRCTYYRRYPYRWCSYHLDKWWSTVYQIVDAEHPQSMATPYPTPLPLQPEDYVSVPGGEGDTTQGPEPQDGAGDGGGPGAWRGDGQGFTHNPRGSEQNHQEFRPEPEVDGSALGHPQAAAPVTDRDSRSVLLGLNVIELICLGVAAVLIIVLLSMCSVMAFYCSRRKKLESVSQQQIEVSAVGDVSTPTGSTPGSTPAGSTLGLIPPDDTV